MPERRDPPPTDEGWFALHDFRTIDWDAWQAATDDERERALKGAVEHLQDLVAVGDAEEGATAVYAVLGHKADLLFVHLRPSTARLDAIERGFETTALARFLDQPTSYVSVTEASGYSERARAYFDGEVADDSGLANYIRSRLHPTVPDVEHVCFYPMDKRRDPEQNWYALPFEERAEHMDAHGDIGRDYAGQVTQMITGSIGLDDWEWGVTLWADDLVDVKDLLYEMRFDASTAEFAEFGPFYVGRRIAPADLPAVLAGEPVPAAGESSARISDVAGRERSVPSAAAGRSTVGGGATASDAGSASADGADASGGPSTGGGRDVTGATTGAGRGDGTGGETSTAGPPPGVAGDDSGGGGAGPEATDAADMTARLATLGLHEGSNFEPGQQGVICYSDADAQELAQEVAELREQFDHYDTHVETAVRAQAGRSAVASLWETERAADTAAGFLVELPGVGESVTGPLGDGVGGDGGGATGDADETTDDAAGATSDASEADASDADTGADTDASTDADPGETAESAGGDEVARATEPGASDESETGAVEPTATPTADGVGAKNIAEAASAAADGRAADGEATAEPAADESGPAGDGDAGGVGDGDAGDDGDGDTGDTDGAVEDVSDGDGAAADAGGVPGGRSTADLIRDELSEQDVYAGQPHGEDVYALVCYSQAEVDELSAAVSDLSDGFDRYDTHEGTDVYADVDGETAAVVSLWATEAAADTASDFLTDLPEIVGWADDREGFGTMGMFYTVEPEHREDFVETFASVGDLLGDMDGHRETALLANVEDENDMFIASQWASQDDAMAFFRSEEFRDTVEWGRDVLADRPRHVFLA